MILGQQLAGMQRDGWMESSQYSPSNTALVRTEFALTLGSEGATRWKPGLFSSPWSSGNIFLTSMNDPGPNLIH